MNEGKTKRHAILMMAHAQPGICGRVVSRLNDLFEIFVHLDAASNAGLFDDLFLSKVISERYRIQWGSYSMVCAQLALARSALRNKNIHSLTLISGDTYMLRQPSEIAKLLDQELDYIDCNKVPKSSPLMERIRNVFLPDTRIGVLRPGLDAMQRYVDEDLFSSIAGAQRSRENREAFLSKYEYAKGSQWWSLARDTLEQILELVDSDVHFTEAMRFSAIPDEAFFQTAYVCVAGKKKAHQSLTYAKWDASPAPYVFSDHGAVPLLKNRWEPFARKFSDASSTLLDRIEDEFWI